MIRILRRNFISCALILGALCITPTAFAMKNTKILTAIEKSIGYRFKDKSLLENAITPPSIDPKTQQLTFAFLGDMILKGEMAFILQKRFGNTCAPKDLSYYKQALENNETLAKLACYLGLHKHIQENKKMPKHGKNLRKKYLADTIEALIAAIHLDSTNAEVPDAHKSFIQKFWTSMLPTNNNQTSCTLPSSPNYNPIDHGDDLLEPWLQRTIQFLTEAKQPYQLTTKRQHKEYTAIAQWHNYEVETTDPVCTIARRKALRALLLKRQKELLILTDMPKTKFFKRLQRTVINPIHLNYLELLLFHIERIKESQQPENPSTIATWRQRSTNYMNSIKTAHGLPMLVEKKSTNDEPTRFEGRIQWFIASMQDIYEDGYAMVANDPTIDNETLI